MQLSQQVNESISKHREILAGLSEDLDWSYYSIDNLQTLCKSCHRKKTNSEVKLRTRRKVKYKTNKFVGKK